MSSCKGFKNQYEVTFEDTTGKDRFSGEYGFGSNPPAVVTAASRKCVEKVIDMVRLRKDKVKIKMIKKA